MSVLGFQIASRDVRQTSGFRVPRGAGRRGQISVFGRLTASRDVL